MLAREALPRHGNEIKAIYGQSPQDTGSQAEPGNQNSNTTSALIAKDKGNAISTSTGFSLHICP